MDFRQALEAAKAGKMIQRSGWKGKNMTVQLQRLDEQSKMTLPYLYLLTADRQLVPWLPSQIDILAEDWSVL